MYRLQCLIYIWIHIQSHEIRTVTRNYADIYRYVCIYTWCIYIYRERERKRERERESSTDIIQISPQSLFGHGFGGPCLRCRPQGPGGDEGALQAGLAWPLLYKMMSGHYEAYVWCIYGFHRIIEDLCKVGRRLILASKDFHSIRLYARAAALASCCW